MRPILLPLTILLFLTPMVARAQVHLGVEIGLPAAPSLSVVAPGIQVVEGSPDEVFLQGGWYWCRRPDGWYRSRSPQSRFDWVDRGRVPGGLSRMPEGRYRNWHHDGAVPAGHRMGQRQAGHERMQPGHERMQGRPHPGGGEPGHPQKP
jgi:hypothetical protein